MKNPLVWCFCVVGFVLWSALGACDGASSQEKPPSEAQGAEGAKEGIAEQKEGDASPNERIPEQVTGQEEAPPSEALGEERTPEASSPERTPEATPETPTDQATEPWKDPVIHQGKATYYDADGTGNCSFPSVSPPMVAAMNEEEYGMADYCGACVRVEGAKGSIVVRIVDRCPECTKGHLDLSREAFAKVDDLVKGVVPITWQVIACPEEKPIRYHYKDGSSQWWTAIQVRDHRLPIKQMELFKDNRWQLLPRQRYNYFLDDKGAGAQPLRIRLTATNGQVIEDTLPPPASDLLVIGKAQFTP